VAPDIGGMRVNTRGEMTAGRREDRAVVMGCAEMFNAYSRVWNNLGS